MYVQLLLRRPGVLIHYPFDEPPDVIIHAFTIESAIIPKSPLWPPQGVGRKINGIVVRTNEIGIFVEMTNQMATGSSMMQVDRTFLEKTRASPERMTRVWSGPDAMLA